MTVDQAAGLREMAREVRGNIIGALRAGGLAAGARVIAVTSGKGGVGKTNFTVNTALAVQEMGCNTLIFDADLGLANAEIILDMQPRFRLPEVLEGSCRLSDAVCTGPKGLKLISGGVALEEMALMSAERVSAFLSQVPLLAANGEFIFLDTGAGLSPQVRAFLIAAPEIVVLTTPEPTAIADAYATIKVVSRCNGGARVHLVVNQAQNEKEALDTADVMRSLVRRYLSREISDLGWIPADPSVARCVREREPFVLAAPQSRAAFAIRELARRLMGSPATPRGWTSFISSYLGGVWRAKSQVLSQG